MPITGTPAAFARPKIDTLVMKNGDRITCEIKSLGQGQLMLGVVVLGETLSWRAAAGFGLILVGAAVGALRDPEQLVRAARQVGMKTAAEHLVGERLAVHREEATGGAVLRRHVGDRRSIGERHRRYALAKEFNGEIVSADSRLFYKGMDIGTAKPTIAERSAVLHHLIDICKPDQTLTLGQYIMMDFLRRKVRLNRGASEIVITTATCRKQKR